MIFAGGWPSWLLGGQSKKLREVGPYAPGVAAVSSILDGARGDDNLEGAPSGVTRSNMEELGSLSPSELLLRSLLPPEFGVKSKHQPKASAVVGGGAGAKEEVPNPQLVALTAYHVGWGLEGRHDEAVEMRIPGTWRPRKRHN